MPYSQENFARYLYEQYGLTPYELAQEGTDINDLINRYNDVQYEEEELSDDDDDYDDDDDDYDEEEDDEESFQ